MLGKLILIFVFVPLADLVLLLMLSDYTGWPFSIAMVILSGIIGAWLAKRSYRSVWNRAAQSGLQSGASDLLTDGAMIFFAAGLLLTPGFITDVVGFSLLIPACRKWYKSKISGWFKRNFKIQTVTFGPRSSQTDEGVVDGEVLPPNASPPKPPPSIEKE